ncbi:MAG: histidine ammonia-lyase [Acidaminococcaceae bacterium]|nr:histidine ammonia-lyase [Acidaminococcaceae bacterium]MCI2110085.1 histidine ammonia-lyase [Acidaminococcaceae bacterium]
MVIITGKDLTIENVVNVARHDEKVVLSEEAKAAINKARAYVEEKLASGAVIYGLTTGFGEFQKVFVPAEDAKTLQHNLIISHSCAMGNPMPIEVARAMVLLRINSVSKGNSGLKLATVQTMIDMLNKGVTPCIPEKGSLGASGDLALLAHMVQPMIGVGEAYYQGKLMSGKEAMNSAGIPIIELASKEGLALINGTQAMCAFGTLALYDAVQMAKMGDVLAGMVCEAQIGIRKAFDPKVHIVRGHQGQIDSAANLLKLTAGSKLTLDENPNPEIVKVQDAYSVRCTPQIHGGVREALKYVWNLMSREINASTDNPLVFPDEDEVISGGNFHGEPVAIALDTLGMAVAELADVSERRLERLVNPALSYGLPAFLCRKGGLNNGFMIAQYAAASMVSENKIYAHPACVDSIPSSANQEDHVSMGTTSARTARMIVDNVRSVQAIELFGVCQALYLRGEDKMSPAAKSVYDCVRAAGVPAVEDDILMHPELVKCEDLIREEKPVKAAEKIVGKLA